MEDLSRILIVTPAEMAEVDRAAALSGIDSFGLMTSAGHAVAAAALRLFPQSQRFIVLCGPGNNGGDGYIAAAALLCSGAVGTKVYCLGTPAQLKGDAARALQACPVTPEELRHYQPVEGDLVIDAIFGAGLARDVPEEIVDLIERIETAGVSVLAVDLPSGVDGLTGAVRGASFTARHTITFAAKKPGHLLLPGRMLTGDLEVADIGIPKRILAAQAGPIRENGPALWSDNARALSAEDHKYRRGHLVVFSGSGLATGAARLSAAAGLHTGAGLVTIGAPDDALAANAAHLTAVMLKRIDTADDLDRWLEDQRLGTFVLGPGFGRPDLVRDFALRLAKRQLVLDADGITAFRDDPQELFSAFSEGQPRLVLTPHEGEFRRLFPDIADLNTISKTERALTAAKRSHAVIVYKGADTVIASPDGRVCINTNAPPQLATAGSGDVLAGMIGAHLAQGMNAYEAAAAGVWRHGEAGQHAGRGLTAETLVQAIQPLPDLR